jgi:Xaa-Pro aminopeptidase
LQEAPDFEAIIYNQGIGQVLPDLFSSLHLVRLGCEGDYLTFTRFREIEGRLKKTNSEGMLIPSEGLIERLRVVKEPGEVVKIRASLRLTESILRSVLETIRPGGTEKSLAWNIERGIREGGGEAVSFPPIVAAGPNAALPHAVPTDRVISAGEPIIFDLGSRLDHYCSDMTRTWVCGAFSEKISEIYSVVREAQLAAQDGVRAGRDSVQVDGIARQVIANAGYGDHFGHGLGHGVGLAVHEKPGVRRHGGAILEENMVITIEPGIYLPGVGGVRLENMVLVTASGCEVLNREGLFID